MIFEITIGKSRFKIPCEDSQKEKLLRLANSLNSRVNNLSIKARSTDEMMILVMAALMMEEELEQKNELSQSNVADEAELYNALSDNMDNIANYIEKLTKKIQNY